MANTTFTNRLCVPRTNKDTNGNLHILGTFCGGLSFPREEGGKPFALVERKSKNDKTYKQVKCSLVISPDNRKSEKGYPTSGIYYDGKYMTFEEVLTAVGCETYNGKLYVTVYMDRNTMGLYQLMADPNLSFKDNVMVSGEMTFFRGSNDGKVRAVITNVSLFARDHVFDDKVDRANTGCMLEDRTSDAGAPAASGGFSSGSAVGFGSGSGYQSPGTMTNGFMEIEDDDGELPF